MRRSAIACCVVLALGGAVFLVAGWPGAGASSSGPTTVDSTADTNTPDGLGVFTFDKGAPSTGPHLTATATDAAGNTSEFSAPTSGTSSSVVLQQGNNLPRTQLQAKRSSELADNRIGGDYGSDHPGSQEAIYDLGLKWLRIGFWDSSLNWQQVGKSPGTHIVPAERDEFVNDMVSNGVNIVLSLGVGSGGNRPDTARFEDEEEIDRYVDYVRFMVQHFKGRIRYYEIWNEPNTDTPWGGISLGNYSELIKRAAAVIRQEYAEAKIVIGATGGWWQSEYPGYGAYGRYVLDLDYLKMLLKSGVAPLVDVISWHPFYGHRPDDPYYQNYPQMVQEIKDLAASQGFKGEHLVEEMLWRTEQADEPQQPVSDIVSAKYLSRAVMIHLGLNVTASASGMWPGRTPDVIRHLGTIMAGAKATNLAIEIRSEATNIKSYSFSLPDGNNLIALWTDGVAVDDDPGAKATLNLQGSSDQEVTGIDVLNGFEQQLLTDTEDGNLVVRDLLVRDYPVILRLRPGVTTSLAQGWNHVCYVESEQSIEEALLPFIEHVAAVYRLRPDQGYDRWFPDRPDVSAITAVSPYKPLLLLMTDNATWNQELAGSPPTSASLEQGWNSTCYAGDAKSADDATAGMAGAFSILYRLGSDQAWGRFLPGRPELSSITQLNQYDSVLVLVTQEGGATWAFNP